MWSALSYVWTGQGGIWFMVCLSMSNIYFNDIFYLKLNADSYNYADDIIASVIGNDVSEIRTTLVNEAQIMNTWFKENSMEANATKFQSSLITPPYGTCQELGIVISDTQITSVSHFKVLGVSFDNHLNFRCHVDGILKKANRQLYVLKRLQGVLDLKSREAIYKSFMTANFNYCPVVWMFAAKCDLLRLERLQERALRYVYKKHSCDITELFSKANCLPIRLSNVHKLATEMYKCMNDMNPQYFKTMFQTKRTEYHLRDSDLLVQPRVRTSTFGLKSVTYFGPKLWNMLPSEIKSAATVGSFKLRLSMWKGPSCQCHLCTLMFGICR